MDQFSDLQSNQIPPQQYPHHGYRSPRTNAFMILSLCCGIFSISSCSILFVSMITCGLGILFASLSRGNDAKYSGLCKAGMITSIFGLICSICVTCFAFFMIFQSKEYREELNEACEQVYGMSFDDMMKEMYPQIELPTPTDE